MILAKTTSRQNKLALLDDPHKQAELGLGLKDDNYNTGNKQ